MLTAFDSDRKEERGEENQKEQARRVLPSTSFILTYSTTRDVETTIQHVSLLYYLYNFTEQYYYHDKKWPRPNEFTTPSAQIWFGKNHRWSHREYDPEEDKGISFSTWTAIGDGEPVEHLQHCSSSRLCTQSKLTTPFQRSKFGGASK